MKRYEEYQSSPEPWMPPVPSHWETMRGKLFFYNNKQLNAGKTCLNVLSLTLGGVINNDIDHPIGLSPEDYSTYQIFEKNDLVFKLIDLENISTSRVGLVHEKGIMSSAYIRLTNRYDCNVRYFYFQYYEKYLRDVYNGLGAGVRSTLSVNDLLNLFVYVPPRAEQDQIVRFLDWKTSRINRLINVHKKEIAHIVELEKAIIGQVATRGLNPTAQMKNSGISWLGGIPKHWDCLKVGSLFSQRKTKVSDKDYAPLSVTKNGVVPQLADAAKSNDGDNRKLVCVGDFVINSRSDRKGSCGVSDFDGSVSLINIVLEPRQEWNGRYVHYLLRSQPFSEEFYRWGRGIVADLWTTRYSEMKNILLPVPPRAEQDQIVEFLDKKASAFQRIIDIQAKRIELLKEYKNRLISDVVTGQIDVRDVEIPEYERVEEVAGPNSEDDEAELEDAESEVE